MEMQTDTLTLEIGRFFKTEKKNVLGSALEEQKGRRKGMGRKKREKKGIY